MDNQDFSKISELDIPWGNLPESKRFALILEVKGLLQKKKDAKDSKNIAEYLFAAATQGDYETFFKEFERLMLFMIVGERAERKRQVDYFVGEIAALQGMERLGKSEPGIIPFPQLAPNNGNLDECSDDEIDAYLLMMSESLTDSPHYETVKDYFRKAANGELDS